MTAQAENQRSTRSRGYSFSSVFSSIVGITLTAIMLFPLYWMLINSFETTQEMFSIPVALFPKHLTIEPYISVFQTQLPHLGTSLLVAVGAALISVLIA